MSDDIFRRELENFRDSAVKVLRTVSEEREKQGNPLSPEILVCIGTPSNEALERHTGNISQASAVLYIHPESTERFVTEKKNIMLLPMTGNSFFRDKTGLFIALSKYRDISLSAEAELEGRYPDEITAVNEAVRQALSNTAQSSAGRLVYLRNALKNLPFILRDCRNEIKIEPRDLAAIVCSAGPSLNGQLDILKKHASKFIVISVGRASKILSSAGIIPDFIVDVDPDVAWFDGKGVPVFSSSAMPDKNIAGTPAVWMHGDAFSVNRYLEVSGIKLPKIVISKTVTVTALDFARYLKCKKIALTGSDLCLSETGSYYTDSEARENEMPSEVSDADGGKVSTTRNLSSLRQSIETYLKTAASEYPAAEFYNCTARGALIHNTERMRFEDFCMNFSSAEDKKISFVKPEKTLAPALPLDSIKSKISAFAEILGEMRDICFKILRELKGSNSSNDKTNNLKQRFMALSEKEKSFKADDTLKWLIAPVEEQGAEFAAQSMKHEKITRDNPVFQIEMLRRKYMFSCDIFSDVISDLYGIISHAFGPEYYERRFKSFRNCAVSFLQKQNPELAAFLSDFKDDGELEFDFIPNLQNSSLIQIVSGGISYPLSITTVSEELEDFLKENKFSPDNDALIFSAPGNWLHVSAFVEKYPFSAAAVIEIWPSLFSRIIETNMLFHVLPETMPVFCFAPQLKQQEKLLRNFIDKLKKEKRRILLFNNPQTFKIPGTAEKCSGIIKLL